MGAGRVVAALGVLLAIVCPSAAQTVVPPEIYQSPQRLVAIDGSRRLNLYCVGSGSPTVLLEAGSGNGMAVWRLVQAEIAKFTQVCAYDRAGLGFSDAAERPSDVRNMTDDLHRLLLAANIPPPIVFVGHSLGGEIAVLLAATYPDELAGAVLVDPGFAGMVQELQAELPPAHRTAIADAMKSSLERQRACLDLARDGKLTEPETEAAKQCVGLSGPADEAARSTARILALPRVWEAMISEMSSYVPGGDGSDVNSAELAAVAFSFGDKPLIVLTRGRTEGAPGVPPDAVAGVEAAWKAGHARLAAASSRGEIVVVPGAGHYIQFGRPDAVIDAARRVVLAVRSQ
jgi:pimeloyl-ACP methyl ester carboxylesterase